EFEQALEKKVKRLARVLHFVLGLRDRDDDPQDLEVLEGTQRGLETEGARIFAEINALHPSYKEPAILSIGWLSKNDTIRRVGDFPIFKRAVVHNARSGFAGKKTQGTS